MAHETETNKSYKTMIKQFKLENTQ